MERLKLTLTEKQIETIQMCIHEQFYFEMSSERTKHLKALDMKLTKLINKNYQDIENRKHR